MNNTSIEWADLTWNCTRGCSRISPGCRFCYAEQIAARFSTHELQDGDTPGGTFAGFAEFRIVGGKREAHWTGRVELVPDKLSEPLAKERWAKKFAAKHGRRPRCFVNSMSDLFHENLPDDAIDQVLAAMALSPWIDFLVLTKRAIRMVNYIGADKFTLRWDEIRKAAALMSRRVMPEFDWPLSNLWLGVSVEDQQRADERIPGLLKTPAAVRFLSCEPLLGPLDLRRYLEPYWTPDSGADPPPWLNWVIVGGESGPGARPMHPEWARSIRNQCVAAGVPFFFKQWGQFQHGSKEFGGSQDYVVLNDGRHCKEQNLDNFQANQDVRDRWQELEPQSMARVGKKAAGRMLDGREWNEFPEEARNA